MATHCFTMLILFGVYLISRVGAYEFTHNRELDPDGKYKISWLLGDETIIVKVVVKTTGWIGLGISPNGKMKGADMVIGWVDAKDNNKKYFSDRHGRGNYEPLVDDHQDYELHELTEKNGETTMIFSRKIKLCDENDHTITADTMRVLYAWNDEDPLENKRITKHTTKGSTSISLLEYGNPVKEDSTETVSKVDVVMDKNKPPEWTTSYWCKAFKLPDMDGKRHMIRIEPVITPGNERYVHHIMLFQCQKAVLEKHLDVTHNCYGENMPDLGCGMDLVVHAWAVGGTTFSYPSDVGYPLNVPGATKYVLLQIYYNNPGKRSDIVDNSGFRLVLTDKLRPNDALMLPLGIRPTSELGILSQLIPQKQKNFTSFAFCPSQCLGISPGQKHYMFAYLLHSHLLGQNIVVRLIRDSDNVEVNRLAQDMNFDFNFQIIRLVKEPIVIPAGHSIHVECTYNTETRTKPVLDSYGTEGEMCIAMLLVYPPINLRACTSRTWSLSTFVMEELKWKLDGNAKISSSSPEDAKQYIGQSPEDALKAKEFWENRSKAFIRNFESAGAKETYSTHCITALGETKQIDKKSALSQNIEEETECEMDTGTGTGKGKGDGKGKGKGDTAAFGDKLIPKLSLILFILFIFKITE